MFKTNKGNVINSYDHTKSVVKGVQSFKKAIRMMDKMVITAPTPEHKLSGIYGHMGYVIDAIGFVFVGPKVSNHFMTQTSCVD